MWGPAPPWLCSPIYIYVEIYIYIYVQVICFIYRSQGLFLINFFKPTSPTKNPLGETVVHETPAVIVEWSPLVSPSCGRLPRRFPRDGASSTPALRSPRPRPSRPPEDKKEKKKGKKEVERDSSTPAFSKGCREHLPLHKCCSSWVMC